MTQSQITSVNKTLLDTNLQNNKGILKLEKIGMKGKINNFLKINLKQFEILKNFQDEISFRLIAYIIKGFFMNLKKGYESVYKDLEYFLEVYFSGKSKPKIKNKKKDETQKLFSLSNLSIFSQFSEFGKLLNEVGNEKKLNQTIKKINKKFKDVDFSKMTEELKKEYFKKNILETLSENLPFSEIFSNFDDNFLKGINSFEDYINFNSNSHEYKNGENLTKKTKKKIEEIEPNDFDNLLNNQDTTCVTSHNLMNDVFQINEKEECRNNQALEFIEVDMEFLNDLMENIGFKNPYLKLDNDINWKIHIPNYLSVKNSLSLNKSDSQIVDTMCEEAFKQITRHYKKIIIAAHLMKFKKNLGIVNNSFDFPLSVINTRNNKEKKDCFDYKSILEKNLNFLIFNSYENISIKNCGRNFQDDFRNENNNNYVDLDSQINELEFPILNNGENIRTNYFLNSEEVNNSIFGTQKYLSPLNIDLIKEEDSKNINESIQNLFHDKMNKMTNFSEINYRNISDEIRTLLDTYCLSSNEAITLAFYNSLIISQRETIDLIQNQPFKKIYIIKL